MEWGPGQGIWGGFYLIWSCNGPASARYRTISVALGYSTEKCPSNQVFWGEFGRPLCNLNSEGHEELVGVDVLEFERELLGLFRRRGARRWAVPKPAVSEDALDDIGLVATFDERGSVSRQGLLAPALALQFTGRGTIPLARERTRELASFAVSGRDILFFTHQRCRRCGRRTHRVG